MTDKIWTGSSRSTGISNAIVRDPDYHWIEPLPPPVLNGRITGMKGSQCGQCGMKFDYDYSYGFHCGNNRCPIGWNR